MEKSFIYGKIVRKTSIPTILWLFDYILEKWCKRSFKKLEAEKNCVKLFFAGILKVNDKNSRIRDPDILVRDMDPRIQIHPIMS
jgi:hypothetical protein